MKILSLSKQRERGAAIAEFLVVGGFVLVPMMTLMPFIGKYMDTKQKTESAARYAAWERTVSFAPGAKGNKASLPFDLKKKSNEQIENEIQHRILGKAETPVYSEQQTDKPKEEDLDVMQRYVNRDDEGKYQLLIEKQDSEKLAKLKMSESEPKNKVNRAINVVQDAISDFGSFDVNTKGLYTSEVNVDVFEPSWFEEFKDLNVSFTSKHMLFTDGWGAGGKKHNTKLVKGLVPLDILGADKLNGIFGMLGSIPGPMKDVGGLELGKVDVDVLPLQRYQK